MKCEPNGECHNGCKGIIARGCSEISKSLLQGAAVLDLTAAQPAQEEASSSAVCSVSATHYLTLLQTGCFEGHACRS